MNFRRIIVLLMIGGFAVPALVPGFTAFTSRPEISASTLEITTVFLLKHPEKFKQFAAAGFQNCLPEDARATLQDPQIMNVLTEMFTRVIGWPAGERIHPESDSAQEFARWLFAEQSKMTDEQIQLMQNLVPEIRSRSMNICLINYVAAEISQNPDI